MGPINEGSRELVSFPDRVGPGNKGSRELVSFPDHVGPGSEQLRALGKQSAHSSLGLWGYVAIGELLIWLFCATYICTMFVCVCNMFVYV